MLIVLWELLHNQNKIKWAFLYNCIKFPWTVSAIKKSKSGTTGYTHHNQANEKDFIAIVGYIHICRSKRGQGVRVTVKCCRVWYTCSYCQASTCVCIFAIAGRAGVLRTASIAKYRNVHTIARYQLHILLNLKRKISVVNTKYVYIEWMTDWQQAVKFIMILFSDRLYVHQWGVTTLNTFHRSF